MYKPTSSSTGARTSSTNHNEGELIRVRTPSLEKLLEHASRFRAYLDAFSRTGQLAVNLENRQLQELKKHCAIIGQMLESETHRTMIPSTIAEYGKHFVYHGDRKYTYLLQTLHVFRGNDRRSARTFGFVRHADSPEPLMHAFSGLKNRAKPHPQLLDNDFWLKEVRSFAKRYRFKFTTSRYDGGIEEGDTQATHSEVKLMLWYAYTMLEERLGVCVPMSERKEHLYRLRAKASGLHAKIYISHCNEKICYDCRAFQDMIQDVTGITFEFDIIKNCGPLTPFRSRGNNHFPRYSEVFEPEPEENCDLHDQRSLDEDFASSIKKLQVVIRSKSKTTTRTTTTTQERVSEVTNDDPFPASAYQAAHTLKKRKYKPSQSIYPQSSKPRKTAWGPLQTPSSNRTRDILGDSLDDHEFGLSPKERHEALKQRFKQCMRRDAQKKVNDDLDLMDSDDAEFLPAQDSRKRRRCH